MGKGKLKNCILCVVIIVVMLFRRHYNCLISGVHIDPGYYDRLKMQHYGFDYLIIGILISLFIAKNQSMINGVICCGIAYCLTMCAWEFRTLSKHAHVFNYLENNIYCFLTFLLISALCYLIVYLNNGTFIAKK